jgi:hypothetical protein
MATSGTNQWGPWQLASNLVGGTPPATGLLVPPQSPSGSVTAESATFNYNGTITSTMEMLADVIQVRSGPSGQPAQNAPVTYNGTAWANAGSYKFA